MAGSLRSGLHKVIMETTDGELIEAVKDWRDNESWRVFHDRYADLITRHAMRCGLGGAEAQEVLQDTMIKLSRALPSFEYDRSVCRFRTWLNQIINQRIVDFYRRKARFSQREISLQNMGIELPDNRPIGVDPVAQAETERAMLEACLARVRDEVSPEHWQLFESYALRGLKADEVSALFHVSVSKVRTTRMRLVRKLQARWNDLLEQPFPGKSES
jgi:RNA polymerase sigma factor (sigma-70 family)